MGVGKLVISLDLELFWGERLFRRLEDCRDELLSARRAVPALLELFSDHRIRGTWAVVGFLFCRSRDELLNCMPARLPTYPDHHRSPYAHIARIGEDERDDPVHYAPSLVDQIAGCPGQEIACHTFSNFPCRDEHRWRSEFDADLQAAIAVARRRDIILRSLVFPDNRVHRDYLDVCRRRGISAYRGRPPSWPYQAGELEGRSMLMRGVRRWVRSADAVVPLTGTRCVARSSGGDDPPVNVPATRRLRPFAGRNRRWLAALQRRRMFAELDSAARNGGIFHLWARVRDFGRGLTAMCRELRRLLERFDAWRRVAKMESVTMHEVVTGTERDSAIGTRRRA